MQTLGLGFTWEQLSPGQRRLAIKLLKQLNNLFGEVGLALG